MNRRVRVLTLCALGVGLFTTAAAQTIITFDAPSAGSGIGQGTEAIDITPGESIVGFYIDATNVSHGFLRAPGGAYTSIDAPGAGTASGQGTLAYSLNPGGVSTGYYVDSLNVAHGFSRSREGAFTTFDAPGAGTNARQGTLPSNTNPKGTIAGSYVDSSGVDHGFIRASDGTITTFDAPGAGTGAGQGTVTALAIAINQSGAISGAYLDASSVFHGFVRAPDGAIATFDVPGAGTS